MGKYRRKAGKEKKVVKRVERIKGMSRNSKRGQSISSSLPRPSTGVNRQSYAISCDRGKIRIFDRNRVLLDKDHQVVDSEKVLVLLEDSHYSGRRCQLIVNKKLHSIHHLHVDLGDNLHKTGSRIPNSKIAIKLLVTRLLTPGSYVLQLTEGPGNGSCCWVDEGYC